MQDDRIVLQQRILMQKSVPVIHNAVMCQNFPSKVLACICNLFGMCFILLQLLDEISQTIKIVRGGEGRYLDVVFLVLQHMVEELIPPIVAVHNDSTA